MSDQLNQKMHQYLCPPGNGVFTVHTAKENKEKLHNTLYQTSEVSLVLEGWKNALSKMGDSDLPCLLGVTIDTGGGIQRGANWGPLFIRTALLKNQEVPYFDLGDVRTIPHLLHDKYLNQETIKNCQQALYPEGEQKLPVSGLSIAEDFCTEFYKTYPNKKLLSLGGDHSVSYALVKPWIKAKREQGRKVAIIHFDAHTDLMPHRLGVDVCFASWAYHMIELLEEPSDLIQLGIRSSGQPKQHWETKLGVQQFWAEDFLNGDTSRINDTILKYLEKRQIDELYISFDIDALDSQYASATGTPEEGGLAPHHCIQVINALSEKFQVTGADLVEVAPFVKSTHYTGLNPEPETTLLNSRLLCNKFLEIMS